MHIKPIGSYPYVYNSNVLSLVSHTGTGGETHLFETKQGGYKKKSRRRLTKRYLKRKKNNRKTIDKK